MLVDSEPLYFEFTRDALASLGVELTLRDYQEINLRQGKNVFSLAADRGVSEEVIERARKQRNRDFSRRIAQGVELMEGVLETLRELHGRVPMAVVTSSLPENLRTMHRAHGLEGFFETVVAAGDTPHFKPHPEPYLLAAERLGVDPGRCVVVEDSQRGLQAAVAAGMSCVAIPNQMTRVGDFSRADRVITSLRELPAIVAGCGP